MKQSLVFLQDRKDLQTYISNTAVSQPRFPLMLNNSSIYLLCTARYTSSTLLFSQIYEVGIVHHYLLLPKPDAKYSLRKICPVCFFHCCYTLSGRRLGLTSETVVHLGKLILNLCHGSQQLAPDSHSLTSPHPTSEAWGGEMDKR